MEELVMIFKLYNLGAQTLVKMLELRGATIEEVRAAADDAERNFFDANEKRLAELRAIVDGTSAPTE
jgi:hypothetical protein